MTARIPLACVAMAVVALSLCHKAGAVDPNRPLDEYGHAVWKPGDDGLDGRPYAVAQSSDGYLWVGTSAGLFRFDGVRFRLWGQNEAGHPFDGPVGSLYSSPDGSLWISTEYKGLTRLKDQRVETIGHYFSAFGTIEDRAGVIWFSNYDANKHELCSFGHNAVPRCITTQHGCDAIAPLGDVIWCGGDTGLLRVERGKQVFMPIAGMESERGQEGVAALIPDDRGGLYVGLDRSGSGLGLEQLSGDRLMPVRVGDLDGSQLQVSTLFKDRRGALWIGTYDKGIYRIYRGRIDHLLLPRGAQILDFAEDREGSIWFTTVHGMERLSDKAVVSISGAQGVDVSEVDGVTVVPAPKALYRTT